MNAQFGAASKAYYRNFAQSSYATASLTGRNIYVINMMICGMLYGGDTVTGDGGDAAKNEAFKAKVGGAYLQRAEQPAEVCTALCRLFYFLNN